MTSVRDYDDRAVADGLNDALARNGGPFDHAAWRQLAAGGWLHMLAGGAATPAEELARLISPMEQWGTALAPGLALLTLAWLLPVLQAGQAEQLADDIARGVVVTATRELTSVDAHPEIRAVPDARRWRLSGQARLVPWLPDADTVLVLASTTGGTRVVAAVPAAGAGVRSTLDETIDPGVSIGDLVLDGWRHGFHLGGRDPPVLPAGPRGRLGARRRRGRGQEAGATRHRAVGSEGVSAHVQRADPADGVVMLTITRREVRNALAQQSWIELRRAAEDIAADPRVRALAWCSPDATEARQAFLEKRSPQFNLDVATER